MSTLFTSSVTESTNKLKLCVIMHLELCEYLRIINLQSCKEIHPLAPRLSLHLSDFQKGPPQESRHSVTYAVQMVEE